MRVRTCKEDEAMKLTVDEVFTFRDNVGGREKRNDAVNAYLDILGDRNVADTVDSLAPLSQREVVKAASSSRLTATTVGISGHNGH